MAELEIVKYGNPVLRQKAAEVTEVNGEIRTIIKGMEEALAKENGLGLAAPQVGVSKRILIIDLSKSNQDRRIALINPRIVYKSIEITSYEEGCLSFPGVWGNVNRPKSIKIKGTLLSGKTMLVEADDLFARVLQHEIDHLDGILFIDHLSEEDKNKNSELISSIIEGSKKSGAVCL